MGSAWNQLEQMLTCAICLDKFKNPRLLPCQHSFCGGACMDGLVDYARRQIKCPECRAEHRIPYQGVESLPLNVTLIRFLELHARITGEEPEPVPTFMEKCAICGEKVEDVKRCAHCAKKVCPDCKEAHMDLLRREIGRINGQSRRSLDKLCEFRDETLNRAEERLVVNHATVRHEIEDSCKRLIGDLQEKQRRLLEEVDLYVEQEQKTLGKLKVAVVDEIRVLESNLKLADDKLTGHKFQWTDAELLECKEIFNKTMEFLRQFDPEIGDFTRKVRFSLVPEFETLRRRLCELGELKFSETAQLLMANSFHLCSASGPVAVDLCQAAAVANQISAQQQQLEQQQQMGFYGLAQSNSNTNLSGSQLASSIGAGQMTLELPNSLMRSQSDHRLASQFQARLKQQEAASMSRYGRQPASDYDSESAMRSRYAPQRPGPKDSHSSDWPRPSDNDSDSMSASMPYKSAFMRRKERQHLAYRTDGEDDDELTGESLYGGANLNASGRNVRFHDGQPVDGQQQQAKVFDCGEVVHAPFSGVPKLDECPQLNTRLHQLTARAIVDKKHAEEEGQHDKDLIESAWLAMSKASQRIGRQASEDEIEKQKQANAAVQQDEQRTAAPVTPTPVTPTTPTAGTYLRAAGRESSVTREPLTGDSVQSAAVRALVAIEAAGQAASARQNSSTTPLTPVIPYAESGVVPGGRRSLYGQAVAASSAESIRRQALRPKDRYISKQPSVDIGEGGGRSSPSRTVARDYRAQVNEESDSASTANRREPDYSSHPLNVDSPVRPASWRPSIGSMLASQSTTDRQTTSTTSDEDDDNDHHAESGQDTGTIRRARQLYQAGGSIAKYSASRASHAGNRLDTNRSLTVDDDDEGENGNEENDSGESERNKNKRRSREFLPSSMNKLLDRSAAIRRNNQEQRTLGDSPQRSGAASVTGGSKPSQSSYLPGGYLSSRPNGGYSSLVGAGSNSSSSNNSGSSAAIRQRLAYQRSLQLADDGATNTATATDSGQSSYLSRSRRRPSNEDRELGAPATNAADRHPVSSSTGRSGIPTTRTAAQSPSPTSASRYSSSRHNLEDSSASGGAGGGGDGGYQSRFLARSRTSAALSAGNDLARSHEQGPGSSSSNRRRWHIGNS